MGFRIVVKTKMIGILSRFRGCMVKIYWHSAAPAEMLLLFFGKFKIATDHIQ
jgi:hypothetical protein